MVARTLMVTGWIAIVGCGTSSASDPTSNAPAGANASAVLDGGTSGTATIDPRVAAVARSATGVIKMKIRLSANGEMVKQSVYHRDASKISGPVRELAESKFPGGSPRRFENEWYAEHGEVHEIEVDTKDGKRCEVAAKPDGTQLYVECYETEASLPDAVKNTIATALPGGKVLEVESKTGPGEGAGVDSFTVEVEFGGTEYYLIITPAGEVQQKLMRIPAIVEVPVD